MDKKGLSYIDWSISLGIFVIFILLLFIMVIPSLDRGLDEDYLISLAETGFRGTAYHEIIKMPLFVSAASNMEVIGVDLPDYPDVNEYQDFVVLSDEFQVLDTVHSGSNIGFSPDGPLSGVNTFYVLYLEDNYVDSSVGLPQYNCEEETPCTFGIHEKIEGLSEANLDDLVGNCTLAFEDYVAFKDKLKYPENREISLEVKDSGGTSRYSCTYREPDASNQVYALSWRDKLLKLDGTGETLTIILRTW